MSSHYTRARPTPASRRFPTSRRRRSTGARTCCHHLSSPSRSAQTARRGDNQARVITRRHRNLGHTTRRVDRHGRNRRFSTRAKRESGTEADSVDGIGAVFGADAADCSRVKVCLGVEVSGVEDDEGPGATVVFVVYGREGEIVGACAVI